MRPLSQNWIARHCTSTSVVSVIAAGEKWPGGELRPAIEDLWGAGAVLSALSATWVGRRLFAGSSGGHDRLADPPAVPVLDDRVFRTASQ
ncbi:hypothetical protein [Rhodococcus sp. WB9]|uniref:hypothetical protein n=1 Tax=Rhodococcus sp. WB9 TaxID=2594007 RepID=UPI0021B18A46|nr:hypothetical protein [Rhodococcus sp. WB9]